ncbi:MAG: carboxypeptidase regulatory-like domain-containing protein [Acidobacteriota bacterium]|nr:carboxypeptidase regulatory-like domain-containing protein [Acidobacteriota bacterium]
MFRSPVCWLRPSWLLALCFAALTLPASAASPPDSLAEPGPPSAIAQEREIPLENPLEVCGLVTWSGSTPAAGVKVELLPWMPADEAGRRRLAGEVQPPPAARGTTDASGRYRLAAPSPGVWRVRILADEAIPLQFLPLILVQAVELPPAALTPARRLEGQVVTPNGDALPGAWIFVRDPQQASSLRAGSPWRDDFRVLQTDATGRFRLLSGLEEELQLTIFPPATSRDRAPLRVEGFRSGQIVWAPSGEERQLRVVNPHRRPLADVLVRMGDLAWPTAVTGADGQATVLVSPNPAGTPPAVQLSLPDGRGLRLGSLPSPVSEGEAPTEERLTILGLPAAATVRGRVVNAAGEPVAGAVVRPGDDPGVFAVTDTGGGYELAVPVGSEQWVQAEAAGHVPRRGRLTPAMVATGRGPTLELIPAARLVGQVVDAAGRPVSAVHLAAMHRPHRGRRPFTATDPADDRAFTGEDGRFLLDRLQPGEGYTVLAWRPGAPAVRATAVAPSASAAGVPLRIVLPSGGGSFGRVLGPDEQPVVGARVSLAAAGGSTQRLGILARREDRGSREEDPFTAFTDEEGRFRTAAVPALELDVVLRAGGFAPLVIRGVAVAAPERQTPERQGPDIQPAKGQAVDLGTFFLTPGASLRGVVLDEEEEPVAGAEVHAIGEELAFPATRAGSQILGLDRRRPDAVTDDEGRFAVDDLPAGDRRSLWVRAAGFLPRSAEGVEAPNDEPVVVVLRRAASVRGIVRDEDGAPVAGAAVALRWQRMGSDGQPVRSAEGRRTETDDEGRFFFDTAPERRARLSVEAAGYVTPPPVNLVTPPEETPVEDVEEVEVVLERGATVRGTVSTESGEPVAEARVTVGGAAAFTDGDGFYALDGVRVGAGVATVVHRSYGRTRRDFEVDEGENTLDWRLPDGRRVTGRVMDSRRQGIAGAEVVLTALDGEEPWEHRDLTDAQGGFSLEPVPSGSYSLEATAAGFAPASSAMPVRVQEAAVEDLEILLRGGTTVHGQVRGLDFERLAQVTVEAHRDGGVVRAGRVDYSGAYRVEDLEPGSWLVVASLPGRRRQAQERVVAEEARGTVQRDLFFGAGVELRGAVRVAGEPLAGATVSLRGQAAAVRRATTTDHRGEFHFRDLDPGSYRLGLHHTLEEILYNDVVEVAEDRFLTIDLRPATVAGRALDGVSGEPLGQVVISLERLAAGSGMVAAGTGADGRFVLRRVPPGRYRLTARRDGWASAQQEIQLAQGQELSDLELVLEPTAGLTLAVSRADGSPPPYVEVLLLDASGQPVVVTRRSPDARGMVRLPAAPPGIGALLVQGPGGALWQRAVAVPAPEPESVTLRAAGALSLQVPALAESNGIAFATLTDASGRPLETLDLVERGLRRRWPLVGGAGVIEGVPAGEWRVEVQAPDGAVWSASLVTTGGAASVVLP